MRTIQRSRFFSCFSSKKSRSSIISTPEPSCSRPTMNYCTFAGHTIAKRLPPHPQVTLISSGKRGSPMAKRKVKRCAVTAVKELARERVGAPPAGQIVVEKKKKPEKHKQNWASCWKSRNKTGQRLVKRHCHGAVCGQINGAGIRTAWRVAAHPASK